MPGVPFVEIKPLTITPCYIQHRIGTIDSLPCTAVIAELMPVFLPISFTGLPIGQQYIDLWAAFTAEYPH